MLQSMVSQSWTQLNSWAELMPLKSIKIRVTKSRFKFHSGHLLLLENCWTSQQFRVLICKTGILSPPSQTAGKVQSVQFSSFTQSCPTLCDPMNRSMPGHPIHYQLPEFTQTHCHRVGDTIQPSHPPSSPSPPALNLSQHQGLLKWVSSLHQVAESIGVSASTLVLPMNTQDWSPLGWTGWISLQSKGLARVFSNTTVQKHQFFGTQLSSQSNSHIHSWPLEKPQPWLNGPLLTK